MALTQEVKDELARVGVSQSSVILAEMAALLRFSGALHLIAGRVVVEAEVDSGVTARRLIQTMDQLLHTKGELRVIGAGNLRRSARYSVRWSDKGEELARRIGLIDRAGRPVRGLPPFIIGGTKEQCVAAWRGAFLAHGSLTEPGRYSALEVSAPCNEAALALVGAARRFDISAKTKETRGSHRVVIRDGEAIGDLLILMGAPQTRLVWEEQRLRREVRGSAYRLANFDDANLRRSARAAVAAAARAERALEILGDDIPQHLAEAGRLRMAYRQESLEELGQQADPPMTKDAVAGRIRRLLSMADKRAEELGIPDTHSVVTEDLFKDLE